jgi:molybdenum cofactor biosynthesis enzyme MoaA
MSQDLTWIESLEIGIIDACNLGCPLCAVVTKPYQGGLRYLPLEDWITILERYTNLQKVLFVGTRSENVLYPHFLKLCRYLKTRDVELEISTNGIPHNEQWWEELKEITDPDDRILFAIDGLTQEVYEKYRVNGNLDRVLRNHAAFAGKGNDYVQYIMFEHNKHEDISELLERFEGRSRVITCTVDQMDGEFGEIRPREEYIKRFKTLYDFIDNKKDFDLECASVKYKEHFINHEGKVSPCCLYDEHLADQTWNLTYDFVDNQEYEFCKIVCDKQICKFRDVLNLYM